MPIKNIGYIPRAVTCMDTSLGFQSRQVYLISWLLFLEIFNIKHLLILALASAFFLVAYYYIVKYM